MRKLFHFLWDNLPLLIIVSFTGWAIIHSLSKWTIDFVIGLFLLVFVISPAHYAIKRKKNIFKTIKYYWLKTWKKGE